MPEASDDLDLEIQGVVRSQMWVLRTELVQSSKCF